MELTRSRNWKCGFWENVLPIVNKVFKFHSPQDITLLLSFQLGLSPQHEHSRVPVINILILNQSFVFPFTVP